MIFNLKEYFKIFPHGGNVHLWKRNLKYSYKEIIDLSASVNPLTKKFISPFFKKLINFLEFYPDPECYELRSAISKAYKIPAESILCGNGSIELIYLTSQIFLPKKNIKIYILEPTFLGYKKALKNISSFEINHFFSLQKEKWLEFLFNLKSKKKNLAIFLCNPNNPTGWILSKKELLEVIEFLPNAIFFIDEAFIDFKEEDSLIDIAYKRENIFVFRSFTKFYGIAGLRLGYVVSHPKNIKKIKKFQIPWSVNIFSQIVGKYLIENGEIKEKILKFFKKEKLFFERALKNLDISFFPSVANFYLLNIKNGSSFTYYLIKEKKILVRNCGNFYGLDENFIRVSIKERGKNKLFLEELKKWLKVS